MWDNLRDLMKKDKWMWKYYRTDIFEIDDIK